MPTKLHLAFLVALVALAAAQTPPKTIEDRKSHKLFFEALVEPMESESIEIPLTDEVEAKFIAATGGIQKWVQDKVSLEGLNLKTEESRAKFEKMAAENKAKAVEFYLKAIKEGKTFQEAHIGMALAQFKRLPEGAQEEAMEKAKERLWARPEGRKVRTREHASEANHMERMQLDQLTTDEERVAWVKDVMENGPPHAKKTREERQKEREAKGK